MRKLASIQKVLEVFPIEGADSIECVKVLGWYCVTKKGEYKPGDLTIYCEVDSVFPEKPEFEFLRGCKFRIRTVKRMGQVSQGICFPLNLLPIGEYNEGDDVTELLGITKYEPPEPACLGGDTKGNFPSFIIKTDETRVQVLQPLLTKYKDTLCYYSEKVDGSSSSFFYNNRLEKPEDFFGVCSRNQELKYTENNTFWAMAQKYDLKYKFKFLNKNIAIQGEVLGEGIQGNKYKLKGHDLFVFNIFDIDKYKYLDFEDFMILSSELQLKTVPILDINFKLIDDIDGLVELSKGFSKLNPQVKREGIVIRPLKEMEERGNGRISFKAINPEFLLKFKDE